VTEAATVTFIGNEGVVVRNSRTAVAIDALFGDGAGEYADTPVALRDAIESARPPYDAIRLISATHFHPDHFNARAVIRHLSGNPDASFVSTAQAVALVVSAPGGVEVRDRLHGMNPPEGERTSIEVDGVRVEAFGLSHGKVHYDDVQHLGLVIYSGKFTMLHLGDGIIDQRALRRAGIFDEAIDMAFVPFWYLTYPFGRRLMGNLLRARRVFAMHIPPAEAAKLASEVTASRPDAVALVRPASTFSVPARA